MFDFFFNFDILKAYWPTLRDGFVVTVELAGLTFAISVIPALLVAMGRRYGPRWLDLSLLAVVTVVRSVPSVVSVVIIFFALPFVGLTFGSFVSVVIALTCVQVVYFSEVFRGGLAAIDKGQFEAAYALGMRTPAVLRRVIVPQSLAVAAPTFTSSCIQLVQNTTIAVVVALGDLLTAGLNIQTVTGNPTGLFVAALLYVLLLLPFVRLARRAERRLARAR
jgi:polar amino acid transport system permease protein